MIYLQSWKTMVKKFTENDLTRAWPSRSLYFMGFPIVASFIQFSAPGSASNMMTVFAESRVNAERTLRALNHLVCMATLSTTHLPLLTTHISFVRRVMFMRRPSTFLPGTDPCIQLKDPTFSIPWQI